MILEVTIPDLIRACHAVPKEEIQPTCCLISQAIKRQMGIDVSTGTLYTTHYGDDDLIVRRFKMDEKARELVRKFDDNRDDLRAMLPVNCELTEIEQSPEE